MSSLQHRRTSVYYPTAFSFIGPFALTAIALSGQAARAQTQTRCNVALSGSLWGSPFQSNFAFDNAGRLSGLSMDVQGTGFRAGLGDVYANWDNLGFAQRSYRGLSLGLPLGKVETTLIGGSVVDVDEFGQERSSPIYGVRAALPLGKKWSLSASQLFSSETRDGNGGSITSLGVKYRLSEKSYLALEQAHSSGGGGWQLSGESAGKRLSVRASYRQTQSGFSQVANPLLRTNRNGGFVSMSYRLSGLLTLAASSQRYSNGNLGNSRADSLRLQFAAPKRPQVALFWESRAQRYSLENDQVDDAFSAKGIELSHSIGDTNFSVRYAAVQRLGSAVRSANGLSDEVGIRLSRQIDQKTRLTFLGNFSLGTRRSASDGQLVAPPSRNFAFINAERRLKSGASVNAGLQYQTSDIFGNSGQAFGVRAGFRIPLSNGTSIGLQYQKRLFSSGSLHNVGNDTLYLNFAQNFNSGRKARPKATTRAQQKLLGQLNGRVFEDLNGNGRYDANEPGVSGIALNLKGNVQGQTDKSGQFSFASVQAGDYRVRLITKTLPIELTTVTPTEVPLQIGAAQTHTVDFPVMRTGRVEGVVFRDDNRNGRRDANETPLSEAMVHVEGSEVIAFTDEQGRFLLSGLPPRTWKIAVDTQMRGDDLAPTNAGPVEVQVPANGEVTGVQLGLAPFQKAVVSTFHKAE